MPTNDFYIKCPFFQSYKETSITCEGTVRHFGTRENRNKQIKRYCETIEGCNYALRWKELYERTDKMSKEEAAIERLEYEVKCKAAEITKLKREQTNLKNKHDHEHQELYKKLEKSRVDERAALYLADANRRMQKEAEEKLYVAKQQIRGLLNFIGYLCHKMKLKKFGLTEVRDFGLKYETMYSIPDEEKDEIIVTLEEKQYEPDRLAN